jgi:predicted acyltransferase
LSLICDKWGFTRWGGFFLVVGANSIVAYVMSWTLKVPVSEALLRHFGGWFEAAAKSLASLASTQESAIPIVQELLVGVGVLGVFWLGLYWLYRQRIFVRI